MARAIAIVFLAGPLGGIVGGPLSAWLISALSGVHGLAGWQWMFLVEGLLASVVGVWAFFYLDNKPHNAKWLSSEEQKLLESAIESEESEKESHGPKGVWKALFNSRVLYLCLVYMDARQRSPYAPRK